MCNTSIAAQHKALRRLLESGSGGGGNVSVMVKGEDVRGALCEVRPSAMREVTVEVPKVSLPSLDHHLTTPYLHMSPLTPHTLTGVVVRYWWAGRCEAETERVCGVAAETPRGKLVVRLQ